MVESLISLVQESLSGFFTRFIVAFILLIVGFIFGRIIGKLIQRGLYEIELNVLVARLSGFRLPLEQIISIIVSYIIYIVSIILALDQLGIKSWAFNIFIGTLIFLLIVSSLLALKDLLPNTIAWFILSRNGIKEKDYIKAEGIEGRITQFGFAQTKIETATGDNYIIPNSILKNTIILKKKSS